MIYFTTRCQRAIICKGNDETIHILDTTPKLNLKVENIVDEITSRFGIDLNKITYIIYGSGKAFLVNNDDKIGLDNKDPNLIKEFRSKMMIAGNLRLIM